MIKKLFSPISLIISIIILSYILYRSEIFWEGENRGYYTHFYYFSFSLIIFSIISFFLKDVIKIYTFIIVLSVVAVLYLFEAFLSYYNNTTFKDIDMYEKNNTEKYDLRDKEEFYNDIKKNDDQIVVTVYPAAILENEKSILPLSGISNSKTIYCNENGYYSVYQSDRYGFNNPDIEWDSNEIEYLLVGDSFTHGACVNQPDDIASVLRTLSNKSVLNLGYGGNGPLFQYATLREYLGKNVKKVLWFYYEGNDLDNLKNRDLKSKILINYLIDLNFDQNLKARQDEINSLGKSIIKDNWKTKKDFYWYKWTNFIKLYKFRNWVRVNNTPIPPQIEPVPEFKKILQLAKNLTIKNNAKLYFIYLPEVSRYKNDSFKSKYNKVKQIVDDLNITFLDMHSLVFEKEEDPLILFPFEKRKHYTIEGYMKIAKEIYNSR